MEELKNILQEMNIPEHRMNDWRWLLRNLGIQNSSHPKFNEAMELIKKEAKKQYL